MEDQVVQSDANPAPPPPKASKPRHGRKPGQPPATHNVAVPAESLAPIHEVAAMTGQKPSDLLAGFRDALAAAAVQFAARYAAEQLAAFEERLTAKKAEMQAAAAGVA